MLCHYNHQADGTPVVFCHSTLMDTLFQLEKKNPDKKDTDAPEFIEKQ